MHRRHRLLFIFGLGLLAIATSASTAPAMNVRDDVAATRIPLLFFPNHGQIDSQVSWAGIRGGLATYFGADSFTVRLDQPVAAGGGESGFRGAALKYTFEASSSSVEIVGEEPKTAQFNFLHGMDPTAWRVGVPGFGVVRYRGIYDGVDLVFRDVGGVLEYDFVLRPGADIDQVRIRCEGADALEIGADGSLIASTKWGDVVQRFPQSWQIDAEGALHGLESRFVLMGDQTYGFVTADRDEKATTVIDPGITYSTFLGGSGAEHGCGASVDDKCGVYVTGDTLSVDYPTVLGSFDSTANGDVDVFVTRLNPNLSDLLYSTFVGGTLGDFGHGVAVPQAGHAVSVDGAGIAHVAGGTRSSDFPVTANAWDSTANGQSDAFLFKLSADGSTLLFSTYIGGIGEDGSLGGQVVALDSHGKAYLTGFASSPDFPVTPLAPDGTHNGMSDIFVSRFTADGQTLDYSTFRGGANVDMGNVIDVDSQGNAYVGGASTSSDFPTTVGAYQNGPLAISQGVVTKVSADGSSVVYSTFTGGSHDTVRGISAFGDECFVAGYCLADPFPTTAGAFQTASSGNGDGFVLHLDSTGGTAIYATLLGGSATDGINDIDTDVNGQAYVSGWTESTDFPVTAAIAFDSTYNGLQDTYCTRLSADGSSLDYSSYLGGSDNDFSFALDVHDVAAFYLVGGTYSADFPVTAGVFDTTHNGSEDVFVTLMPASPVACTGTAAMAVYGTGEPDSAGNVASLAALNLPTVPSAGVQIQLTNATPSALTFFLVGTASTSVPFDQGTVLVVPQMIVPMGSTDATGTLNLLLPIAENPNFCDDNVFVQAAVVDPNLITFYHVALSNGLHLTFGS